MAESNKKSPKKTTNRNIASNSSRRSSVSSDTSQTSLSAGTTGKKNSSRTSSSNKKNSGTGKTTELERRGYISRTAPEVGHRNNKNSNYEAKRDDIIIIIVTLLCVLMFLSYLGICGIVGTGINAFIFGLFGRLGYILPFIVWILTIFFIANKDNGVSPLGALYAVLLSSVLGALIQLAAGGYNKEIGLWDYFGNSSLNYEGEFPTYGGLLGGIFVKLLCPFVGQVAAVLILIALLLILFVLMTGKPFIMAVFRKIERRIEAYRRRKAIEKAEQDYADGSAEQTEYHTDNGKHTKLRYGVRQVPGRRMGTRQVTFGKKSVPDALRDGKKDGFSDGANERYASDIKQGSAQNTGIGQNKPVGKKDIRNSDNSVKRKSNEINSGDTSQPKAESIYIPGVGSVRLGANSNLEIHEEEYTEKDFEEARAEIERERAAKLKKETSRKEDIFEDNSKITSVGVKKLHSGSIGRNLDENGSKIIGIHDTHKTQTGSDKNEYDNEVYNSQEIKEQKSEEISNQSNIPSETDDRYEVQAVSDVINISRSGGYSNDDEIAESVNEVLREDIVEQETLKPSEEVFQSINEETDKNPDIEDENDQEIQNKQINSSENVLSISDRINQDRKPREVSSEEIRSADAKEVGEQYAKVTRIGSGAASFSDESKLSQMMTAEPSMQEYKFPPIEFLKKGKSQQQDNGAKREELENTIQKLQSTFESFGVGVKVTDASVGPTVTRYELLPDQGVKVKTITSLSDDIKLALAAAEIRIEAPIPGKAAVGIEVPNKESAPVLFGDLIDSDEFKKSKTNLAFAVGKDISGKNIVSDIGDMPHALIAGATGSGKSVCINALIMSILYKAKPTEVKMIMVDPKRVELVGYNGIPHLIVPVVTDVKKAAGALAWAVAEMDDRYKRFADAGVRDLKGFNKLMQENYEEEGNTGDCPEKLPQIVIIVDELNDLMMTANSKEVEADISRLTQLARACGIHVILATQRPSVNVITGTIKANIPTRIAFAVSSIVDSRTILDQAGAEKLLGKGDMLFYPRGCNKPVRLQGVYVSDDEVNKVVQFIKEQYKEIKYNELVNSHIEANAAGNKEGKEEAAQASDANANDPLFVECGRYIIEKQKSSVGALQRVFKIGFNRAARIMDQLCEAGVVGPEEGTKARTILMSKEEFEDFISTMN